MLDEQQRLGSIEILREDEVYAKAQDIRMAARKPRLEAADSHALKEALRSAMRTVREFRLGEPICYWRRGRRHGMKKVRGRWHGRAIVVSKEGWNFYISHNGR